MSGAPQDVATADSVDESGPQRALSAVAVVVAGGQGLRFRPWSRVLPKILTPVGERALLDLIADQVIAAGIHTMYLLVGPHSATISAYVSGRRFEDRGLTVVLNTDTAGMGTAGPLRTIDSDARHWLVINGDIYAEVPLADVLAESDKTAADLMIVTAKYAHRVPYGVVRVDEDQRVVEVIEKPVSELDVNAGIYVLGEAARAQLRPVGTDDMTDLIGRCLQRGLKVHSRPIDGAWHDIGTPESWYQAHAEMEAADR